jgi:hypothetical protein
MYSTRLSSAMQIGMAGGRGGGRMAGEGKLGAVSELVVCCDDIGAQKLDSTYSGCAVSAYDHAPAVLSSTS